MQPSFFEQQSTATSTTFPVSAQELTVGDLRLLRSKRDWDDRVTVYALRLATPSWDVVKRLSGRVDALLVRADEPSGQFIASEARDEGYGSTALVWVPEHARNYLVRTIQQLQDGAHSQSHGEIFRRLTAF
jgi:hypothetical protein